MTMMMMVCVFGMVGVVVVSVEGVVDQDQLRDHSSALVLVYRKPHLSVC